MFDERIDHTIDTMEFREDVPEDVVQRFDDVKSVLEAARKNKRLVRTAAEYSIATFELSLRVLCDRLGFEDAMDREAEQTLWNFIQWLHGRDYLPRYAAEMPEDLPPYSRVGSEADEPRIPEFYHSLRDLRNRWLHPFSDAWLGWFATKLIPRTTALINDFFEDPKLRQEERTERRCISGHCKRLSQKGVALDFPGERVLVHEVNMLHYDKTVEPPAYYFAFWPLFDCDPDIGQELSDRRPYLAKCHEWAVRDGSLGLSTVQDTSIALDRDLSLSERSEFESWLEEAGTVPQVPLGFYGPANLRSMLLGLNAHFPFLTRRDFHWID